jgi:adenylate cyclase
MSDTGTPASIQEQPDAPAQTILVVDDAPVNRRILERLLTRHGYQVLTADSGSAALELLNRNQPDLLIFDIVMPGQDGFSLCRAVKERERLRDIPVIFISSLESPEDKVAGFSVGGVDFITKPFHPDEVLARISTHLKLCRLQRELAIRNQQLLLEMQKSEALLLNILPMPVARELIDTGTFRPQRFDNVTVCFVDLVDFTAKAAQLEPEVLIEELNDIFSGFDHIVMRWGCERMKTIGDAYLYVCGMPEPDDDHAGRAVAASLDMIRFLIERNRHMANTWQVRIGIHTGSVIGGIVGIGRYLYDIFGDTVNLASRLERLAPPMRIMVSLPVWDLIKDRYTCVMEDELEVKGKGRLTACLIEAPQE